MQIIIPLNSGSQHDNAELRYALRSVQEWYPDAEVTIVGDLPNWLVNVKHIPFADHRHACFKDRNICAKFLVACGYRLNRQGRCVPWQEYRNNQGKEEVLEMRMVGNGASDAVGEWAACVPDRLSALDSGRRIVSLPFVPLTGDFLFMNDDHFLMSAIDNDYWCELLPDALNRLGRTSGYRKVLYNTVAYLKQRGARLYNFDMHCPMVMNVEQFVHIMSRVDWSRAYGYGVKSIYGNMSELDGEQYPDVKMGNPDVDITGRKFFSVGDGAMPGVIVRLQEMWPEKSKWEI